MTKEEAKQFLQQQLTQDGFIVSVLSRPEQQFPNLNVTGEQSEEHKTNVKLDIRRRINERMVRLKKRSRLQNVLISKGFGVGTEASKKKKGGIKKKNVQTEEDSEDAAGPSTSGT
ncbi:unnamed protein product [Meloidogyne enterolobii]|uniref:Uncharacterized protein n=1 Tax=Meloidogyne enterolobii TaxID=390850 RepID=A0ACB1A4A1_MELEN